MATAAQVAHYQGLAREAQGIAVLRAMRAEQIEANRQQAARIAGLTWGDVACAIRALGMPEPLSEREQAEADERDRADNELDARRERECEAAEHYADVKSDEAAARYFEERRDAL